MAVAISKPALNALSGRMNRGEQALPELGLVDGFEGDLLEGFVHGIEADRCGRVCRDLFGALPVTVWTGIFEELVSFPAQADGPRPCCPVDCDLGRFDQTG